MEKSTRSATDFAFLGADQILMVPSFSSPLSRDNSLSLSIFGLIPFKFFG